MSYPFNLAVGEFFNHATGNVLEVLGIIDAGAGEYITRPVLFGEARDFYILDGDNTPPATTGPIIDIANYITPDSQADQNAGWQLAMTAAQGGRLVVPAGVWWFGLENLNDALRPDSNTQIEIQDGAYMRQLGTDLHASMSFFRVDAKANVSFYVNGIVEGGIDRQTFSESQLAGGFNEMGENTFFIWVDGSDNVVFRGLGTITKFYGDGIFVGGFLGESTGIDIDYITCDDNRRQGTSIVWADGVVFGDHFKMINTGKTAAALGYGHTYGSTIRQRPTCGIDFEPDAGKWVKNAVVGKGLVDGCYGNGITVQAPYTPFICNVVLNGTTVTNNGLEGTPNTSLKTRATHGIEVKEGGYAEVNDCITDNNHGSGLMVAGGLGTRENLAENQGRAIINNHKSRNNGAYGYDLANDAVGGDNTLTNSESSGNGLGDLNQSGGTPNTLSGNNF